MTNQNQSDLQKLIEDFESATADLRNLDESDKEERDLVNEAYTKLKALQAEVNSVLAGNERARRERLVKLSNLQELLKPILFPENKINGSTEEKKYNPRFFKVVPL